MPILGCVARKDATPNIDESWLIADSDPTQAALLDQDCLTQPRAGRHQEWVPWIFLRLIASAKPDDAITRSNVVSHKTRPLGLENTLNCYSVF